MKSPEERLAELGITLPTAPKPIASYVPAVQSGSLIYLSGMLPLRDGKLTHTGIVGREVNHDEAKEAARQCAINALSVLKDFRGSLDNLRCLRITGYVASAPDFTGQPGVINGASDLMADVFGERGRHARSAVGANVLPLNSPVEIEFIFESS